MSPAVISLACLGFFFSQRLWAQVGGQNKPFLSAWPSPMVPQGQHVTLHCRSHHKFEIFRLYKDNDIFISKLHSTISQNGVFIGPVTPEHAGTYRCRGSYRASPSVWSAPSDPLVIVVTGVYRKPSLLAQAGPLVKSRGNMTLVCCSEILFESFILHREGVSKDPLYRAGRHHHGGSCANFSVGPVTAAHAGTYRCFGSLYRSSHVWSAPSDPLDIMITGLSVDPGTKAQAGTLPKPTIWADPGSVRPCGTGVTIWCQGCLEAQEYHLHKEGKLETMDRQKPLEPRDKAKFSITHMTDVHAGRYHCDYLSPTGWSELSDPPELVVVTGLQEKPSLWAQPGTMVRTGENVTLSCCSERSFDVYHLSRDEQPHECWLAKGQKHGSATQADFPLGPAHPALGGTYRCHGSFNTSPYEWSGPSDPLYLSVTGNPRHQQVLAVPLVVIVFLTILLFFLTRQWCPPKEDAAIMNREPEVDRMLSREDPQAEDPQEVTYTQLDHCVFMQKNTTPTSQRPGEPLHDDSVYMELATG